LQKSLSTAAYPSGESQLGLQFVSAYSSIMLSSLIFAIGAITLITFIYRIYNFVKLYFVHQSTLPQYLHPGKNTYALVTGSSDGIGLATAKALQQRGFNVILHGRNPEKLARISKSMSQEFPNLKTVVVAADASDPVPSVSKVAKVVEEVESSGGKLTVLINNIGGLAMFGLSPYSTLNEIPLDVVNKQLGLNMTFPTLLTRALLPTLITNKPALVINIGSYAGVYGMAFVTTYAPSKAFNHMFSTSLSAELKHLKLPVEVLGIIVGSVQTPGNPDDAPSFRTLTPEEMARDILGKVGCGKALVVGSWKQCLVGQSVGWLPEQVAEQVMSTEMSKRAEREAKKT
jgi:17beta-estradiol 17-dehydrogenase / very-long-chain 3-oxoacyl-CoA reductase